MTRNEAHLKYLGRTLGFSLLAFGYVAVVVFIAVLAVLIAVQDQVSDLSIAWLLPLWGAIAVPLGRYFRRTNPSVAALLLGHAYLLVPVGLALIARF